MKNQKEQNHSHEWHGTWSRPMHIDEDSLDPLTVARMTDHNVRGIDRDQTRKNGDHVVTELTISVINL
jgi:hypothetical protein